MSEPLEKPPFESLTAPQADYGCLSAIEIYNAILQYADGGSDDREAFIQQSIRFFNSRCFGTMRL